MRAILLPISTGLLTMAVTALGFPSVLVGIAVAGVVGWTDHAMRRRIHLAAERFEAERMRTLQMREEQLANTAHELRTPLTAVTTAIELLRDGYATTPEDWSVFLDQASVAARHMAFLINDVVDLAAIECGRISLHVKEQRVQELLFDISQVMQLTAQQRNIDLHIDDPSGGLVVVADRGRFLQIAFNLIGNAIKFSEAAAIVRMTTHAEDDRVTFEVHDGGLGIEPAKRDLLFTRFGRTHDRSKPAIAGTGLGLHVCKLLVEHMGGTIGYRPGAERGSVFWFTLPRAVQRAHSECQLPVAGAEVALAESAPA